MHLEGHLEEPMQERATIDITCPDPCLLTQNILNNDTVPLFIVTSIIPGTNQRAHILQQGTPFLKAGCVGPILGFLLHLLTCHLNDEGIV
jgi:hypothetical protein